MKAESFAFGRYASDMKAGAPLAIVLTMSMIASDALAEESARESAYPPLEMQSPGWFAFGATTLFGGVGAGIAGAIVAAENEARAPGLVLLGAGAAGIAIGLPAFWYGSTRIVPEVRTTRTSASTVLTLAF
jgi:hypothetical protein